MKLHIERRGETGIPLVLIHGWGFHSGVWGTLAAALTSDISLHLVDLPGHGRSPDPMPNCDLDETAATLAEALPSQATWLGWSLGGLLALAAALARPESVGRLVLLASSPRFVAGPAWPHGIAPEVLDSLALELGRNSSGTLSRFIALQCRGAANASRTARLLTAAIREGPPARLSGLECGLAWLRATDLRPRLGQIRCPVRILLGERDTLVRPAVLPDILAIRPDWTGAVLQGAGHAPFLTDPGELSNVLTGDLHDVA